MDVDTHTASLLTSGIDHAAVIFHNGSRLCQTQAVSADAVRSLRHGAGLPHAPLVGDGQPHPAGRFHGYDGGLSDDRGQCKPEQEKFHDRADEPF